MVYDYAKQSTPPGRHRKRKIILLMWVLIAMAVIPLFYYFYNYHHVKSQLPLSPIPAHTQPIATVTPAPEFDFYRMLPTMEVEIPQDTSTTPTSVSTASATTDRYLLQVASFQSTAEAEHLKSQLITLGHKAIITSYHAPDGTLWTRVLTGPYSSLTEAIQAQTLLHRQKMDSVLLRNR